MEKATKDFEEEYLKYLGEKKLNTEIRVDEIERNLSVLRNIRKVYIKNYINQCKTTQVVQQNLTEQLNEKIREIDLLKDNLHSQKVNFENRNLAAQKKYETLYNHYEKLRESLSTVFSTLENLRCKFEPDCKIELSASEQSASFESSDTSILDFSKILDSCYMDGCENEDTINVQKKDTELQNSVKEFPLNTKETSEKDDRKSDDSKIQNEAVNEQQKNDINSDAINISDEDRPEGRPKGCLEVPPENCMEEHSEDRPEVYLEDCPEVAEENQSPTNENAQLVMKPKTKKTKKRSKNFKKRFIA